MTLYNGNDINKIIEIIEDVVSVIFNADFKIILGEVIFEAQFWLTTVEIEKEEIDNISVKVGRIILMILIPSMVKILDSKSLYTNPKIFMIAAIIKINSKFDIFFIYITFFLS